MAAPRNTSRSSMIELINGPETGVGETTIRYSIFTTDSFESQSTMTFYDSPGHSDFADGAKNDDSYRNSRHLVNRKGDDGSNDNLRENSLARQIQDKPDRQATIRLVRRTTVKDREKAIQTHGKDSLAPWTNIIPPNTKFFLESVQEDREEKVQVIDTFGEWVAFFFGNKPEVHRYSGTLLNAANHNWKNEFQQNYDYFLRGSQAVKNKAVVVLQYDDVIVEGYIINNSIQMSASQDKAVPFSFSMLVTRRSPLDPREILLMRRERGGKVGGLTESEEALLKMMNDSFTPGGSGPFSRAIRAGNLDKMATFLLMREYFAGNFFPGAGMAKIYNDTNVTEGEGSKPPGAVGGASADKPKSSSFENKTVRSAALVGIDLDFLLLE